MGDVQVRHLTVIGYKETVTRSCANCDVCKATRYGVQGDTGFAVECGHPNAPVENWIGDTSWTTPEWCPAGEALPPEPARYDHAPDTH